MISTKKTKSNKSFYFYCSRFVYRISQGDNVSQGKIRKRGREYLDSEVPKLDYITACHVTAENQPWHYVEPDEKRKNRSD
jgi:hypothetical protein